MKSIRQLAILGFVLFSFALCSISYACPNTSAHTGWVKCDTSGCTGSRNQPTSETYGLANAAISTFSLCPGDSVYTIGIVHNPSGYAETDTYFDVDSNSQAVFSYSETNNEQTVVPPPGDGYCPTDAICFAGTIYYSGFDYNGGGWWTKSP